jgi:hemolysin III
MAGTMNEESCPITGDTWEEERISWLTHFWGLVFSCVGSVFLILATLYIGNTTHIISCSIYATSLILLYAASTYYHACKSMSMKSILKICDHACIYLLIAGTYTPYALGPLRDSGGHIMLTVIWTIAAIGIIFKICAINRFKALSLISYLMMGWLVVFQFHILFQELTWTALVLLISGGLAYTLGTIFYVWDSLPYNHGIWHLFVLAGSLCHYNSVFNVVLMDRG